MKIQIGLQDAPIAWPTNLAWRLKLKRFANVEAIVDIRKDVVFALPFKNWVGTYWQLLGKDVDKLKHMPTQIVEVPNDALVADMDTFDSAMFLMHGHKGQVTPDAQKVLKHYQDSAVTYRKFVEDPYMFSRPEILIPRSRFKTTNLKLVVTEQPDEDEPNAPLLGVK